MAVNPWTFTHLEVKGDKHPFSPNVGEQIPVLRVETQKDFLKRKPAIPQQAPLRRSESPRRQKTSLSPQPSKQKIVTIKVVLPKQKSRIAELNCLCSCELPKAKSKGFVTEKRQIATDELAPAEPIFGDLLDILKKYDGGVRNEATSAIRTLTRKFKTHRVLSDNETEEILKMLETDNSSVKEGVLILLRQLSTSTVNTKKFLERGLLDELVLLLLLGNNEDLQREAVNCISELVDKQEHAGLWLEAIVISGFEALFDLLDASSSCDLQKAVLGAVGRLAQFPKTAELLSEFKLQQIVDLLPCKDSDGSYKGTSELQTLATKILANLISHSCPLVDSFLSRYAACVGSIVDLLQFGSCIQQQESARFLATLAFFKSGLGPIVSHHAVEHLLWAVTCSHCRLVREQASRALKNVCVNPDKQAVYSALSQVTESKNKRKLSDRISTHQCESLTDLSTSSSHSAARDLSRQASPVPSRRASPVPSRRVSPAPSRQISPVPSRETGYQSMSKVERTIAEVASVLALSCRSDCLSLPERAPPSKQTAGSASGSRSPAAMLAPTSLDEEYLASLRVLTNVLVALRHLVLVDGSSDDNTPEASVDAPRVQQSRVALLTQFGGLNFIEQLHFVSSRIGSVNPPSYRNIDPTILPPKEVTCTMRHARNKLMFSNENKPHGQPGDFGLHVCEINFVREAVNFVLLVARATVTAFDLAAEDARVLEISKRRKKKLTFHQSALAVKGAVRFSHSQRISRSSSARSLSSDTSHGSLETPTPTLEIDPTSHSKDEDLHFIKENLLDSKVIYALAPWLTCGIHDIQDSVLKAIRILVHNDKRPSASGLPGNAAPVREGWARKDGRPLTRRSSRRALPDAIGSVTTSLSYLCVRHVMQHCGPYLLDLLSPPAARGLGRTSLMAIREAAINGESETRLNFVKLGFFSQVIEFIRANEDDDSLQALAVVVVRDVVGQQWSLRQLFFAHGGMNLIMALHEYKEGIVKEQAALTLVNFTSRGIHRRAGQSHKEKSKSTTARRAKTAHELTRRRQQPSALARDIWDRVETKWKNQDEVVKVLKKFAVKY